jgi:hypothetical protein
LNIAGLISKGNRPVIPHKREIRRRLLQKTNQERLPDKGSRLKSGAAPQL